MKTIEEWEGGNEQDRRFLSQCKEAVQELCPEADVILFGSRARGEASPDADYDLLILTPQHPRPALKDSIHHRLYDLELEYEVVTTTLVYSRRRWNGRPWRAAPLHKEVERDGVVL